MEHITVDNKLVLGCVMAWHDQKLVVEDQPPGFSVERPAVLEYCPVDDDGSKRLAVTERMKDLAIAGFRPIAIVSCGSDSLGLSIHALEDSTESMRALLGKESEAIFKAVMEHLERGDV